MAEHIDAKFARANGECRSLWIGYNDRANEGIWVWTDGSPSGFTHWWAGEPNNMGGSAGVGREHCASIAIDCIYGFLDVGNQWADSGCGAGDFEYHPRQSVCQLPLVPSAEERERNEILEAFCRDRCLEQGFCCNDFTLGGNELLSCAQACMSARAQ